MSKIKSVEEVLRELFATGYDPVQLNVTPRGINEANLEVVIAGNRFSIKGNNIECLDQEAKAPQSEAPANDSAAAGTPELAGSGTRDGEVDNRPGAVNETAQERLNAITAGFGGYTIGQPDATVDVWTVMDAAGAPIVSGSLDQLEAEIKANVEHNALLQRVLVAFDAVEIKQVGETDENEAVAGIPIFSIVDGEGNELDRGTIEELEQRSAQLPKNPHADDANVDAAGNSLVTGVNLNG